MYIPTSAYTGKTLIDSDFMYTEPVAEEIPTSEYEQAVLYIQDEDEEAMYAQANVSVVIKVK